LEVKSALAAILVDRQDFIGRRRNRDVANRDRSHRTADAQSRSGRPGGPLEGAIEIVRPEIADEPLRLACIDDPHFILPANRALNSLRLLPAWSWCVPHR